MSNTSSFRKVTGLSVEKWAAFQLKQLQPKMQTVWGRQHGRTNAIEDKNHNNELVDVLTEIMKIFVEYDADKPQSITTFSPEGMLDLLRTFAIYYSDCNPTNRQEFLEGIHSLSASFFKMISGALNREEITFNQANEDNSVATNQNSSSLSFLAGFSSLGVEDVAVFLLTNLRTSIEQRFGAVLRGIPMDHTVRATESQEKEQWLREQLQFTTSFLQFTQLVMQFHSNRKKLYTSICEVLLPSTLRLISFCRLMMDDSNKAGSNLSSNDNILIVECLTPLYQQLQGVLESGLFDEKAVEEIATMSLIETERKENSSSFYNNKTKGNKKARKEDAAVVNNDEPEKSSSASVIQQKYNKAFHDVLFRALSTEYFYAEIEEGQVPAGCAIASRDDLFARGVAALLELYSRRSQSMAVQASTQGQGGGRWGSTAVGRDEMMGMDAVNTRKHLVRVFHFTFLLLEAFEVKPVDGVSVVESLRMLSSVPLNTTASSSNSSSKKRKSLGAAAIVSEGLSSTGAEASVCMVIKRGLVHNEVLAACVRVMQEQAIPNHDSLQRYVERLHSLSRSRVQQCLSLQTLLSEDNSIKSVVIAPWVQQLSILDLQCVRAVARIDHTTVVDSQLGSVLRMLAGGDIDLSDDHRDGLLKLRVAKRELLFAVLGVHGELRLLDQFVDEAVALEERSLSTWDGQESLQGNVLREILLGQDASTKLVKLFSALPTGQGPKLWEYLARIKGNGQEAAVLAEVTTCVLARALMQAQLLTVRSNASVFAASTADAPSTVTAADAVDSTTRHLVSLLWKLTSTVQWAVEAQASLSLHFVVTIVQQGLSTISALLRFVAHYQSGATTQLLVPVLDTPASYPGKAGKVGLFHIAMNPLLNALVALQRNAILSNEVLRTSLSLLLLSSNVSAKIPAAAVDYEAQITVLKKLLVGSLSASPGNQDASNVDLLLIVLRDTRVWAQLAPTRTGDTTGLSVENFASLFRCFLRAASCCDDTSTNIIVDNRLHQVSALLQSASVTDNSMIREAVVSALLTEWKVCQSAKKSSVVQRGMFLCSAFRKLPEEFLSTARSFSSDLFAHLSESFLMLASNSSNLDAANMGVLQQSTDYAAAVLLGLARGSQYSRLTVQDRVCSGATVQPSAEAKAVEVMSAILLSAGSGRSCSDGDEVMATLEERLPAVLELTGHFLSNSRISGSQQGSMGALLSLQLDAFLSHLLDHLRSHEDQRVSAMFQQSWSEIAKLVLKASTVADDSTFCIEETKRLFRAVLNVLLARFVPPKTSAEESSGVDALMLSAVQQLLSDLIPSSSADTAAAMGKAKTSRKSSGGSKSSSSVPVWTDTRFHFIAECASTVATLNNPRNSAGSSLVPSVRGLSEPDVSVLIHALLEHTVGFVNGTSVTIQQQNGWLRLFDIVSSPLLLHTGVVALPQSSMTESASTRLELSTQSVVIHTGKLSTLLRLLARVMSAGSSTTASVVNEEGDCSAQSLAVLSLLSGILYFTLRCRLCNIESAQILEIFRVSLLDHMKPCRSTAICRDLLVYFTEHGRKLLTAGSKEARERFQKFHDGLTSQVVSFYQQSVTGISNDSINMDQITLILQQTHVITTAATSALQRQGRSGARRKNKENDTKSSSVFRFDIWFDGLLVLLSLATSHMHSWKSIHTVQKNSRLVSEIDEEGDNNSTLNNATTVLLTKAVLQNLERVIAVSSSSALPNLNTSVGVVSTLLTSCIALLLAIEHQLPAALTVGVSTHSMHSKTQQFLRVNLNSCYHLLCRVSGNIGSSQVLEKHIHFLASAVVETLSKASLTRNFQDIAMPGVFALFEKCQSRQKTQMFAMLDAQSRVLMTDLHSEFMRTFKFVGK